nr:hypothetical protein RSP597_20915 [Ralstonia solanacearum]
MAASRQSTVARCRGTRALGTGGAGGIDHDGVFRARDARHMAQGRFHVGEPAGVSGMSRQVDPAVFDPHLDRAMAIRREPLEGRARQYRDGPIAQPRAVRAGKDGCGRYGRMPGAGARLTDLGGERGVHGGES